MSRREDVLDELIGLHRTEIEYRAWSIDRCAPLTPRPTRAMVTTNVARDGRCREVRRR